MKVALYDGKGTMRGAEVSMPVAGPGDALIRVRASGICGSDLLDHQHRDTPDKFPTGHEVAGEIVDVGQRADRGRIGERIALEGPDSGLSCLKCWYCRMGQYVHCQNKVEWEGGGFAEYTKQGITGCFPVPDNVSWEEAAMAEPFSVGIHSVRHAEMGGGETVAVLGAGTIGLCAVAAARTLGAGKIFVTARHPRQAEMARRLGADEAVSPEGDALWEAVAGATDGRGADLTLETVGGRSDEVLRQAVHVTRPQGRIATMGNFYVPVTLDWKEILPKELSIIASAVYGVIDGRHDYEVAIDLMASGRVDLKQLVTHKFPLHEIQEGFNAAHDKAGGAIKVQIHMEAGA